MNPALFLSKAVSTTRWPLRAVVTIGSWALAAGLVAGVGPAVAADSGARAALLFKLTVILAVSGSLATGPLRRRGLEPTLWTGLAWLALTIVAEVATALLVRHGWCELLGNPDVPWMRNVLMLTWLAAPALFTRGDQW